MNDRLLIGAALLCWGWQTGWLILALPMLALLEAAYWIPWRWAFSRQDFNRLVDLTNILFVGVSIYLFMEYGSRGVFQIIKWLPVVLFLLLLGQRYSSAGHLTMGNLFLSLRRSRGEAARRAARPVSLDIPYFGICLIAAFIEAPNSDSLWLLMFAFLVASLYPRRSRRYAGLHWLLLMATVAGLGYLGQQGIRQLHAVIEDAVLSWFDQRHWSRRNPYQAQTAIGDLGRLKLSDTIVLRVAGSADQPPGLLRQSSYQAYHYGVWRAMDDDFTEVDNSAQESWTLDPRPATGPGLRITGESYKGKAVLALPGATRRVDLLLAGSMQRNPLGTVRIQDAPEFLQYTGYPAPSSQRDEPPSGADLEITHPYLPVIRETAERLRLANRRPRDVVAVLGDYFRENFSYSLIYRPRSRSMPPLNEFLTGSHRGHCEYFASATVLLLRAANIPARYATGYSVQEYSPWEDRWLVRRRHAHAWAIAYIDGRWQDIDLTPPDWFADEAALASRWQPVRDLLSWLAHRFQLWRWQEEDDSDSRLPWLWLLLPLGLWLGWRLQRRKTTRQDRPGAGRGPDPLLAGTVATPFQAIADYLADNLVPRQAGETTAAWIERIQGRRQDRELDDLLRLHYRMRFDPRALAARELEQFSRRSRSWLRHARNPATPADPPDPGA